MKSNKNTILNKISNSATEKLLVLTAAAVAIIGVGGSVLAYGPERSTYTIEKPADHVTFNSITNNPAYGDERNFLTIKEADAPNSQYRDSVEVQPGKEYQAYVYFHNNASKTLNSDKYQNKGVALDAKMRLAMPDSVKAGSKTGMAAFVSASNAKPAEVFDDAFLTAKRDVAIRYVPGSAKITSKGAVNGQTLSDGLFGKGALLGYDSLNGKLPGCNEFSGYVTFKFRADAADFNISKEIRISGQKNWSKSVNAKPGDNVDFKIEYKNTGSIIQDNVVVKDRIPYGMILNNSSVKLYNAKAPNGATQNDSVVQNGLNVGAYKPNGNFAVTLSAKIRDDIKSCGPTELVNTVTINTANGNKQDTAKAVVNIDCKKPIEVCDISSKKIIKIDENDFDQSKHSKNKSDCQSSGSSIEVCDKASQTIVTITENQFNEQKYSRDKNDCSNPTELPTTGPAEIMLSIIGLGALVAAAVYWYKSREDLKKVISGAGSGESSKLEAQTETKDPKKLEKETTSNDKK